MAARDEIVSFCDELLDIGAFEDYGPNGLQVPGGAEVTKVVSGVSASRAFIEAAIDSGAQLALAHHGLFWSKGPIAISEQMAARLRPAFAAGLSIAAYHLPLDAHREIGNNALLCEGLGFTLDEAEFGVVNGRGIGVIGRASDGVEREELARRVSELVGREPLRFDTGPELVGSIGIVSGAGSSQIGEAVDAGLDALLTGEPAERAMADAEEGEINFIAAGHYATETFGIRRLGELVAERFGVEHEFIDLPNPI
jgi:dinuclear metal center YbgI/SA1388 family protein